MSDLFEADRNLEARLDKAYYRVWRWEVADAVKPTQQDRILAEFLRAAGTTVCGAKFLEMHIPRYAARILELRNDGFDIQAGPCQHGMNVVDYELL